MRAARPLLAQPMRRIASSPAALSADALSTRPLASETPPTSAILVQIPPPYCPACRTVVGSKCELEPDETDYDLLSCNTLLYYACPIFGPPRPNRKQALRATRPRTPVGRSAHGGDTAGA